MDRQTDETNPLVGLTESLQNTLISLQRLREYENQLHLLRDQSQYVSRQYAVISYLIALVREYRRKYGLLPENHAIGSQHFESELYGDILFDICEKVILFCQIRQRVISSICICGCFSQLAVAFFRCAQEA